jgi:nicotinamide mononucleotide transporter
VTLSAEVLTTIERIAMVTGVAFAILAARRNRLCWLAGGVSSACAAVVAGMRDLPMQSGLQVFFVAMAVYGWLNWTRNATQGELPVGTWRMQWHAGAAIAIVALSFASAQVLARETQAAWPLMDSLTTWFSLLATWLQARARLENWLYWIVIDAALAWLFYMQKSPYLALLNVLFIVIAAVGFVAWLRRFRAQAVTA